MTLSNKRIEGHIGPYVCCESSMPRFDYILAVTMAISLLWGMVILALGAVIRFNFNKLVNGLLEGLDSAYLEGCKNQASQNICPVTRTISGDVDFGDWVPLIGSFVIIVGFLVVVFSIVGFAAALKHSTPLIILYIIICLIATGLQFYLVQIATSEDNGFHQSARSQLKQKLITDYSIEGKDSLFTPALNGIQITMKCCGIDGIRDYENLTYVDKFQASESTGNKITFVSPPSCCKRDRFFCSGCSDANFISLSQCAKVGYNTASFVNTKGCYGEMFRYFGETSGSIVLATLLFIIVWEMLQIVFGILVKFTPVPEQGAPPQPPPEPEVIEAEVKEPEVVVVEAFIPHARPSTYNHPDPTRIKSTEIW